jgi:mxaJ protein
MKVVAIVFALLLASPAAAGTLRICADPNNLPFSTQRQEGFENKIAVLLAEDLHDELSYTWWAQRRGFVRHTLKAGLCDVIMGVPANYEMVETTRPYYRSSYVFVTRKGDALDIASFDDPQLRTLRIGVQMIGDDASNTPPAHALARRGIVENVRGFMIYGDYNSPEPTAPIVDAVAKGDIDVAIAWGPQAGYFAAREPVPLSLKPVKPWLDGPRLPMAYDISAGVLRGNGALRTALDSALVRNKAAVDRLLRSYQVPLVPGHAMHESSP